MYPTVHINGTSKRELLDNACEDCGALREVIKTLCMHAPNARDYYPQGPEAFDIAIKAHFARIKKIKSVIAEIEDIGEHIAN